MSRATELLDAARLARAMHDADWPDEHRWPCEVHRDYYERVAAVYAVEYAREVDGVPLATGAKR